MFDLVLDVINNVENLKKDQECLNKIGDEIMIQYLKDVVNSGDQNSEIIQNFNRYIEKGGKFTIIHSDDSYMYFIEYEVNRFDRYLKYKPNDYEIKYVKSHTHFKYDDKDYLEIKYLEKNLMLFNKILANSFILIDTNLYNKYFVRH